MKNKLRPCTVNGKNALFHTWYEHAFVVEALITGQVGGQVRDTYALVEYEDGTVNSVRVQDVKFLESPHSEYAFSKSDVAKPPDPRRMPVLGTKGESVPFYILEPHEEQALKNHGQTLQRLMERGGLSWNEIWCILRDKKFTETVTPPEAKLMVQEYCYRNGGGFTK